MGKQIILSTIDALWLTKLSCAAIALIILLSNVYYRVSVVTYMPKELAYL